MSCTAVSSSSGGSGVRSEGTTRLVDGGQASGGVEIVVQKSKVSLRNYHLHRREASDIYSFDSESFRYIRPTGHLISKK